MSKSIHDWFSEYAESHRNKVNKLVHWICIPAIYFSVVCLLTLPKISFAINEHERYNITASTIAIVLVLLFYIRLSKPLALGMGVFSIVCVALAHQLSTLSTPLWMSSLIIFSVAWIGQFIGHKIEGKKPSFLKDIQFLLIGPAWLMSFLYKKAGIAY
jgi:uncharacterized membrane protein YGL010W